jgi:cytoskeletal protein RodZ
MSADRTPGDFGSRLRVARERRGITLRQIANATKISVGVLDALERNDISRLPGGIFGRAFVRSYAVEVGLDPEATIQDFMATFPNDSVTAGHPTSERNDDFELLESDRRRAGTYLSLVAISIPIAGAMLWVGAGRRMRDTPAPSAAVTAAPAPTRTQPAVGPTAPPPPAPALSTPAVVPTAAPPADTPAPAGAASPLVREELTVALLVKRPCWVTATIDGQKTLDRLLQAGEQQTIDVRRELVLTVGDASAVSMTLNGAAARPLGKAGEVVTTHLTPNNFKDYLVR